MAMWTVLRHFRYQRPLSIMKIPPLLRKALRVQGKDVDAHRRLPIFAELWTRLKVAFWIL